MKKYLLMAMFITLPVIAGTMYEWRDPVTGKLKLSDKPPSSGVQYWLEGQPSPEEIEAKKKQEIELKSAKEQQEAARKSEEAKHVAELDAEITGDFFDQPDKLCNALNSEGLQTQGWKPSNSIPGEYICMTKLVSFGIEGPSGMSSNIAFYVNGTKSDRANDIRIKVNINNPSTRKEAFQKLRSATSALFKAFNANVPSRLEKAFLKEEPISFETSFGKAELIYEQGRIDIFKVVLTNKAFITQQKEAVAASASDFESCKSIIARVVGYSASNLQGDGKPIEEQGYKSFMLKGNNKDIFFCEVHPRGKFRIRAALGGQIPFKVIAEGNF